MPRFSLFHPLAFSFSTRFSRPFTSVGWQISLVCCTLGAWQCAAPGARADEFSALPANDPIALQFAVIATGPAPASLTRYEAALQTARAILDAQNRDARTVSRAQWRAIAALCVSLKSELRQLGVDGEAARAMALKALKDTDSAGQKTVRKGSAARETASTPAKTPSSPFLGFELVSSAAVSGATASRGAFDVQLTPRLRLATQLQTAGRSANGEVTADLASRFAPRAASSDAKNATLASQTALSYDLGRFLTLRAANSRLNWNGASESPLLGAPLFAGASRASGTGGGVDLNLGSALKFSTDVERLRADNGAGASRIGGGASLSAWQDRFSLNMSLSRLLPQDKTAPPATAAELGASLDVSQRLSLSLGYQGLFAPTPSISASRVAGGVSLSF